MPAHSIDGSSASARTVVRAPTVTWHDAYQLSARQCRGGWHAVHDRDLGSFSVAPDGQPNPGNQADEIEPAREMMVVQHWLDELRCVTPLE
jgi:hypothetical protein